MRKYESIVFKKFDKGRGQKFFELEKIRRYYADDSIDFDQDRQVIISPIFSFSGFAIIPDVDTVVKAQHSDILGDYLFYTALDSGTSEMDLYRAAVGGSWVYKRSIASVDQALRGFSAFDRFYCFYYDTGGNYKMKYTTSAAGAFVDVGSWSVNDNLYGQVMIGSVLYMACGTKILKTTDGTTFTTFSSENVTKVFELGGFLFGFIDSKLVRFFTDGSFENVRNFHVDWEDIDFAVMGDKVIISVYLDYAITLYSYDVNKDTIHKFLFLDDQTYYSCALFTFENSQCFLNLETKSGDDYYHDIYAVLADNSYYHYHQFAANFHPLHLVPFPQQPFFELVHDVAGGNASRMYKFVFGTFSGTSFLYLSIIQLFGDLPKQIILRHAPLKKAAASDVAEVNIYIKEDMASSWGSSVLESKAENATMKVYDFPKGKELEFLQIAVSLTPNTDYDIPEDVSVQFLYKKAGLKNSR